VNSTSQILDVSVRPESRVVCKIPAWMIGVVIDHNLIASPAPVGDDVVVVWRDVPVEAIKPEPLPVTSLKPEDMLGSDTTGKTSVFPGSGNLVMRIAGTAFMAYPLIVLCMNVRRFRMTLPVRGDPVLRPTWLNTRSLGSSPNIGSPRSLGSSRRGRSPGRLGSPHGSFISHGRRTVGRDVSAAKLRSATATFSSTLPPTAPFILRKNHHAKQNRQTCNLLQANAPGVSCP
jgi:hypothetical protein